LRRGPGNAGASGASLRSDAAGCRAADGPAEAMNARALAHGFLPAAGAEDESGNARLTVALITFGTMLATIMQSLDMTISNVALPYMAGSFAASYDESTWVLTSYIVAAAIMTPPTGWLAARFGRRRLFLVSVIGFTLASVLCGLAQSLPEAVVTRALQGMLGAALVPLSQATLFDTYPRERHASAMAIWGMGIMLGPILGPTLGGWLTEHWSWRWVYFVNLPVGVLAAVMIGGFVREGERRAPSRFDLFGFATLSIAVAGLQVVLDRGELEDWFDSPVLVVTAVVAAVAFYVFLVQMFSARAPFVRADLFTNRNFVLGMIIGFIVSVVLMGTMALFPPLLENLLQFPVQTVGLLLAPRGFGTMAAMLLVGRLAMVVQPRLLMFFGFIVSCVALYGMAGFSLQIGPHEVIVWGVVQGFGLGFIFPPLTSTSFSTLPPDRRTEAAGIYNLVRNIGASVGISVMTALVDHNTQTMHASLAAGLSPFDRALQGGATHLLDPNLPAGAALLNVEVTRQAAMVAYLDDFRLMLVLALIAAPLVLLMRTPPGTKR
jgi:MFS transporter, DHA2 family, multidrug resistance protein